MKATRDECAINQSARGREGGSQIAERKKGRNFALGRPVLRKWAAIGRRKGFFWQVRMDSVWRQKSQGREKQREVGPWVARLRTEKEKRGKGAMLKRSNTSTRRVSALSALETYG